MCAEKCGGGGERRSSSPNKNRGPSSFMVKRSSTCDLKCYGNFFSHLEEEGITITHQSAATLKPLKGQVKFIDPLVTKHHAAGKPQAPRSVVARQAHPQADRMQNPRTIHYRTYKDKILQIIL